MIEMSKTSRISQNQINNKVLIACAFHKDKFITNFCTKQECLLPMCPSCVSIHSNQHREQGTHGDFSGLQQLIENISELLFKTNKSLEDLSEQYTQDYWNKQKILQSCKQQLLNQKKRLIKQIDRKFIQIQYKMTRKINQFQDKTHDYYKQMQSQIQYLYDSTNKQRQQFISSNEKVLKNIIQFYSQRKQEKIKEWMNKFKLTVDQLKKSSIKINCSQDILDFVRNIQQFFTIQQFKDQANQYLISTGRQLLSSNTKRKRVDSPRWTQEKQNSMTVRPNPTHYKTPSGKQDNLFANESNKTFKLSTKDPLQWSAGKF